MPNWCSNTLEVSGEDIEQFKEDVKSKDSEFSFESLIPIPDCEGLTFEEIKDKLSETQLKECVFTKEGKFDWYDYCINKWGTKWDATDVDFNYDDDLLTYTFQTAWSPPESWIIEVSQRYNCRFELTSYEEGCDFWFHLVIDDGEVIEKETLTIKERIMNEMEGSSMYKDVKRRFIEKLSELEFDEDNKVFEIDELREIVEELDCEMGAFSLCLLFDDFREGYYKLKKLISKKN